MLSATRFRGHRGKTIARFESRPRTATPGSVVGMPRVALPHDANASLESTARIARDLIRFDTTNYGEGRSNGETDAAEYVGALPRGWASSP